MRKLNHHCRVCGLFRTEPPWGVDNNTPTYEFCPCCGVEYGHEDYTVESAIAYRKEWLEEGAAWLMPKFKPQNWDLRTQLKDIPAEYQ